MWHKKRGELQDSNGGISLVENIATIARQLSREYRFDADPARVGLFVLALAPGNGAASALRPLFADWGEAEWRRLAEIADDEVMLTWVAHRLRHDTLGCPESALAEIQNKSALRRKWNRIIGLAAIDLCNRLNSVGIYATILKGAPLSFVCYGEPDIRDVRDIDLLVAPENAFAAAQQLEAAGYVCEMSPEWLKQRMPLKTMRQISFRSLGGAIEVDLHWKVSNEWVSPSTNKISVAHNSRKLVIFEREVSWLGKETALKFAASNVANSHAVELKACVDYLRLTASEETDANGRTPQSRQKVALRLLGDDQAKAIRRAAGLPLYLVYRDLFSSERANAPTRVSVWLRNLARTKSFRSLAVLLLVAGAPTKSFYVRKDGANNNGPLMRVTELRNKSLRD